MLGRARILSAFTDGACLLEFNTRATFGSHSVPFFIRRGICRHARGLGRARAGGFVKRLHPSDVPSEDIYQIPHWTNESLMGDAEAQGHKLILEIIVGH